MRLQKIKIFIIVLFGIFFSSGIYSFAGTVCFPYQGCTGTSTVPTLGQILVGQSNGIYAPQATSTLGISADLSGYVPYTGATGTLNLGAQDFTTTGTLGAAGLGIGTSPTANYKINVLANQDLLRLGYYNEKSTGRTIAEFGMASGGGDAFFDMRAHGSAYSETLFDTSMTDAVALIAQYDANFVIGNFANAPLIFGTNNTKRLTIEADGDFDFASGDLTTTGTGTFGSGTSFEIILGNPSSIYAAYGRDDSGNAGYIGYSGYSFYGQKATGGTGAGYFTDNTRSVTLADGTYAINAVGDITTTGIYYGDGSGLTGLPSAAWVGTATSDLDMAEYDIHNVVTLNVDHIGENTTSHGITFDNKVDVTGGTGVSAVLGDTYTGVKGVNTSYGTGRLGDGDNGAAVSGIRDSSGSAGYFSDGTRTVILSDGSNTGYFTDGTRTVYLADSSYAVNASAGGINVNASSFYYFGGTQGVSDTYDDGTDTVITFSGGIATGISTPFNLSTVTDIKPLPSVLDKISTIRPLEYKYNNKTRYGFVADDLTDYSFAQFNDRHQIGQKGVRKDAMIAILMKAVQELKAKNDALELRVKALER